MANNQYFPTQMNYPMKWRSKATWQFGSLAAAATWRIQLQNRKPIDIEDREAERGIERGRGVEGSQICGRSLPPKQVIPAFTL